MSTWAPCPGHRSSGVTYRQSGHSLPGPGASRSTLVLKKPIGKALEVYTATMARLDASGGGAPADRDKAGGRLGANVRRAERRFEAEATAATQARADAAIIDRAHDRLSSYDSALNNDAVHFNAFTYRLALLTDNPLDDCQESLSSAPPQTLGALSIGLSRCLELLKTATLPARVRFTTTA